MSYHGMPASGAGYGPGYGPPPYPPQPSQGRYINNNAPQNAESFMHTMNPQHMQYTHPVNNGGVYYQEAQHAPPPNVPHQSVYYQAPQVVHHQYYHQYSEQLQQPHPPQFQQRFVPQYDGRSQQRQQPSQSIQRAARPVPRQSQIQQPPIPRATAPPRPKPSEPVVAKKIEPESTPIDLQMLLLALAEEYFEAAHKMSLDVARTMSETPLDNYQALIATGLGCLESCLKNKRLAPRQEAKIRLRYAGVLLEETENFMEAETALSKGITLCEQNRYFDLKYSMQILLAKLMYIKNPRTSLKALDTYITDAEAYRHTSWVYVLRFLRASLSINTTRASDLHASLQNLRSISALANDRGDRAVFLASSLMEVLVNLHSPTPDSVEQIQRALAAANMYQLDTRDNVPQLTALTHILDVTCSLLYSSSKQASPKVKAMQVTMDAFFKDSTSWDSSTNSFEIPISRMQGEPQVSSQDSRGVLGITGDGRDMIMMTFLPKNTVFALSYLLSGVVSLHKSCIDGKAVSFLQQGLKLLSQQENSESVKMPLNEVREDSQQRIILRSYFHVYLAFCYAAATDWKSARGQLAKLDGAMHVVVGDNAKSLSFIYTYLSGICYQGTGDLENALQTFRDPIFSLSSTFEVGTMEGQIHRDLAILASLNCLWIRQHDRHHDIIENTDMIAKLEPLCVNHPNKDIDIAFSLIKATVDTEPPVSNLKVKGYLKSALDGSKTTANTQFLCITLSIMCKRFFVGVVGEQAEKAARAASIQGHNSGSKLWMSVADGMLAQSLETQGKVDEARKVLAEARRIAAISLQVSQQ